MFAVFKVGDEHPPKARVRRQIGLVPTALLSQFADPLAKGDADTVMCHVAMMHVLFTLSVVSALHRAEVAERVKNFESHITGF